MCTIIYIIRNQHTDKEKQMAKFIELHDSVDKTPIIINLDSIDCVYYDHEDRATVVEGSNYAFNVYETVDAVQRLLYQVSEINK